MEGSRPNQADDGGECYGGCGCRDADHHGHGGHPGDDRCKEDSCKDSQDTAYAGKDCSLCKELAQDPSFIGADGFFQTDLSCTLCYGYQHNVRKYWRSITAAGWCFH